MSTVPHSDRPVWGLAGFALGVIALAIVTLQVSSFLTGPEENPGSAIGEIAAEIRNAAVRGLMGQPEPAPEVPPMTIMDYVIFAAPFLAGLATIAGGIGLFMKETPQLPMLAIGFGVSAFVMQYAIFLALLIAGVILLVSIIRNLDGILGT